MSLINDMLRDLANQQHGASPTLDDPQQLLAESGLVRKPRQIWAPSVLIFVVALMVLVGVQQLFFSRTNNQPSVAVESAAEKTMAGKQIEKIQPEPSVAEQKLPEQNRPLSAAADLAIPQTDETPKPIAEQPTSFAQESQAVVSVDRAQQVAIDALLQLAAKSLTQDRLTSPMEDSAYHYYQQILAIDAQNTAALAGKEKITERYLQLATEAQQLQQYERAETFLRRAKLVTPNNANIVLQQTQWMETANDKVHDKTEIKNTEVNNTVSDDQLNAVAIPLPDLPTQQMAITSTSKAEPEFYTLPEPKTPVTSELQVTPNREWQDQQAEVDARALMAQGQLQSARVQLEGFLRQQGTANRASQLLCQIYLEQGDITAASELLASSNSALWPAVNRARLRAQWYLAKGDQQAALTTLEEFLSEAETDEAYRALMASVYHSTGHYHESAANYRRLLSTFGEKFAYWLGLALALDELKQHASAVEAYRRAQNFQPIQREVQQYIEQRITALTN